MKFSYEEVKQDIESRGWQLLSTEYSSLKENLEVECQLNHKSYISYEKLRNDSFVCPICKQNEYYKMENKIPAKKGKYRILAFDQATITSGYSIFDDMNLVSYGLHTSKGIHSIEKISNTKYWIASLIKQAKPDLVVLEDIQLQKFNDKDEAVITYKKLAHLQGIIMNYLYENNIEYKIVHQATWRKFNELKGKTRTDLKQNGQLKIKEKFKISVSNDVADAILIGRWAAENCKKKEIEIIEF